MTHTGEPKESMTVRRESGGWMQPSATLLIVASIMVGTGRVSRAAPALIDTEPAGGAETWSAIVSLPIDRGVVAAPTETSWSEVEMLEIPVDAMSHGQDHAFRFMPPEDWSFFASTSAEPLRSSVVFLEDGHELGPSNASHTTIREVGAGAFSHWGTLLYFSSSDNSDPRTNGRRYELRLQKEYHDVEVRVAGAAAYCVDVPHERILNDAVSVENAGVLPIASPWLVANGAPDWFDVDSIVHEISATSVDQDDQGIAEATWAFLVRQTYHHEPATGGPDAHDPVRYLNVYGYGFCDDAARVFAGLTRAAGLESRVWMLDGHVVPEVSYAGGWHMYDPDLECCFVSEAGDVLGVERLSREPGFLVSPKRPEADVSSYARIVDPDYVASLYASTEDNYVLDEDPAPAATMAFVLGPGESIERDWVGRVGFVETRWKEVPTSYGNGVWRSPPLSLLHGGRDWVRTLSLPYPIVRVGVARCDDGGSDSPAAELWLTIPGGACVAMSRDRASVDGLPGWAASFSGQEPVYSTTIGIRRLAAESSGPAEIQLEASFQLAPRSLPRLGPGLNEVVFRSASPGARVVIHHRYIAAP